MYVLNIIHNVNEDMYTRYVILTDHRLILYLWVNIMFVY